MLKEYLEETYGYNEPIFINEIKLDNYNQNAIRQHFKRMTKSGDLVRFDTGIYYFPQKSDLLKRSYLDPEKVIRQKYVQTNFETFGYYSGLYLANQLHLTTQMPSVIEIITNKETTNGRNVTLGGLRLRLKRSSTTINKDNVRILQFLTAVSLAEKYSELTRKETISRLNQYLKACCFTKNQLADVLPYVTAQTSKKLIEWGLIYEFT